MKSRKADGSRLSTRSHFQDKQPLSTGSEDDAAQVKPAGQDWQVERQGQASTLEWKCYYHSGSKSNSPEGSAATLTLQEALELFRPDFISRSQGRLRRMEWRARKRRALQTSTVELMQVLKEEPGKLKKCTTPDPLSDNLFKPRERSISGREMQLRSRRIYNLLPEVTKKKQEERNKAVAQTNRLRAEVYKKKLLDQILQR
ncbi:(E2-independent) E3 ubiquitin-conjugating enzyme FATS-like [Synchiropus splendidus]|uniref:(E2-independent) E3 ubiquitin-conjugating enzyme FATS-like n=1 Tax=Synchiropus splendidus TaxID=270530 RepID=UPI00237E0E8C|nr:(E2-independent) E3 ubiquitin-conjugating enzyme FATS-like [Synchiropus splendidus]